MHWSEIEEMEVSRSKNKKACGDWIFCSKSGCQRVRPKRFPISCYYAANMKCTMRPASGILVEHARSTYQFLTTFLYDLLDAIFTVPTSRAFRFPHGRPPNCERWCQKFKSIVQPMMKWLWKNNAPQTRVRFGEFLARGHGQSLAVLDDDFATAEREFRSSGEFLPIF